MMKIHPFSFHVMLFGAVWGLSEVTLDKLSGLSEPHLRALLLSLIALGVVIFARTIQDLRGSTLAMAGVAALFKFLNAPFWGCQILAILLWGGLFEGLFDLRWADAEHQREWIRRRVPPLVVGNFLLFALLATFVLKNPWWAKGGLPRIFWYVLLGGIPTAFLSWILLPLIQSLGQKIAFSWNQWQRHHRLAYSAISLVCAGITAGVSLLVS